MINKRGFGAVLGGVVLLWDLSSVRGTYSKRPVATNDLCEMLDIPHRTVVE